MFVILVTRWSCLRKPAPLRSLTRERNPDNAGPWPRRTSMKTATRRLDKLTEEKRSLQTQLVQIQAMLYSIDNYISDELLLQVEMMDEEGDKR